MNINIQPDHSTSLQPSPRLSQPVDGPDRHLCDALNDEVLEEGDSFKASNTDSTGGVGSGSMWESDLVIWLELAVSSPTT